MSLFIPATTPLGATWLPSEVRRRLVAARDGAASPLTLDADGSDHRQALPFSVGENLQLEALAGDEAIAAVDLLAALHGGELDSFVVIGGAVSRIAGRYWEPRHDAALVCVGDASRATYSPPVLLLLEEGHSAEELDAWNARLIEEEAAAQERYHDDLAIERSIQRSALLWGEDTIGNHPDQPVDRSFIGIHVLIERQAASKWISAHSHRSTARLTGDWKEEAERVASLLDENRKAIRDVTRNDVDQEWDRKYGEPPKVSAITNFMKGKGKGGRTPNITV